MRTTTAIPTALQVLMNHIYELHKGVRHMVLFTCNNKYGEQVVSRLESQGIPYLLQPAGRQNQNIYFGRRECLEAIRLIVCSATTSAHNANGTVSVKMDAKAIATATVSTRINHIIIYKKNERNNCNLWFLDRNLRGHRREDCLETGLRGPERTGPDSRHRGRQPESDPRHLDMGRRRIAGRLVRRS